MKRWLQNWAEAAPRLEQERWAGVSAMTEEETRRVTAQLFALWQPEWPSDEGEALLLHQRVFTRARRVP